MKITNILIERYISGEMSDSEKRAFEIRMLTDVDLQKEVQLRKTVDVVISDKGYRQIVDTLSKIRIDVLKNEAIWH